MSAEDGGSGSRSLDGEALLAIFEAVEGIADAYAAKEIGGTHRVYLPRNAQPSAGQYLGILLRLRAAFAEQRMVLAGDRESLDAAAAASRRVRHHLAGEAAAFVHYHHRRVAAMLGAQAIPSDLAFDHEVYDSRCRSLGDLLASVGYATWSPPRDR